ncbi:YybS family protein [Eubacteriales bacterium OttesenSCG-928-K08]|nr:YybS family protein [Eubacteriales bacterium OttesenSCG-928-K08]
METVYKKPTLLTTLLVGLAGAAGAFAPIATLASPALLAYLLLGGGFAQFALAAALAGAGSFLLVGTVGLQAFVRLMLITLCLYLMLRKKRSYFDTAMFTSALVTVLLYVVVSLQDYIDGTPAFYNAQLLFSEVWESTTQQMRMLLEQPGQSFYGMPALTEAQLNEFERMGRMIVAQTPTYMPMVLCFMGAATGLSNTLLCVRFCKNTKAQLRPTHPFAFWRLPKSFMQGLLVMGGGLILAAIIGISSLDAVLFAVLVVALVPLSLQGVATYWLLMGARRSASAMRTIMLVLLVLTLPFSVVMMAIVGIIEQFMHLRRRALNPPGDGDNDD